MVFVVVRGRLCLVDALSNSKSILITMSLAENQFDGVTSLLESIAKLKFITWIFAHIYLFAQREFGRARVKFFRMEMRTAFLRKMKMSQRSTAQFHSSHLPFSKCVMLFLAFFSLILTWNIYRIFVIVVVVHTLSLFERPLLFNSQTVSMRYRISNAI